MRKGIDLMLPSDSDNSLITVAINSDRKVTMTMAEAKKVAFYLVTLFGVAHFIPEAMMKQIFALARMGCTINDKECDRD